MKKFAMAAFSVAVLVAFSSSAHATYVVDDFDEPDDPGQQKLAIANTQTTLSVLSNGIAVAGSDSRLHHDSGILGGTRDLELTRQPVGADKNFSVNLGIDTNNPDGSVYHQIPKLNNQTVDGSFKITWDGKADGTGVGSHPGSNPNPRETASDPISAFAAGEDLTEGGTDKLVEFRVIAGSPTTVHLRLSIYNAAGVEVAFLDKNPLVLAGSQTLAYQLNNFSGSLAALSNAFAVRLTIDPVAAKGDTSVSLDRVAFVSTPEPSSIALLGLGILGLAGRHLRRRKQAA